MVASKSFASLRLRTRWMNGKMRRDHPSSAKAASIRASIGVGPNCDSIRFASVRC